MAFEIAARASLRDTFALKMAAHDALDEDSPDELVLNLLARALIYNRRGAPFLFGPTGATTSMSYPFRWRAWAIT